MIKVLVSWEREEEIERAVAISSKIHDLLDSLDLHSGVSRVNDPLKTFSLEIREEKR